MSRLISSVGPDYKIHVHLQSSAENAYVTKCTGKSENKLNNIEVQIPSTVEFSKGGIWNEAHITIKSTILHKLGF